jgi:hypothetical protein
MAELQLSFDAWKEGDVAPAKLKVPVRLPEAQAAKKR